LKSERRSQVASPQGRWERKGKVSVLKGGRASLQNGGGIRRGSNKEAFNGRKGWPGPLKIKLQSHCGDAKDRNARRSKKSSIQTKINERREKKD